MEGHRRIRELQEGSHRPGRPRAVPTSNSMDLRLRSAVGAHDFRPRSGPCPVVQRHVHEGPEALSNPHAPALRLPRVPVRLGVVGHVQPGIRLHQPGAVGRGVHPVVDGPVDRQGGRPHRQPVAGVPLHVHRLDGRSAVHPGRHPGSLSDRRRERLAHLHEDQAATAHGAAGTAAHQFLRLQLQQLRPHLHADPRWPPIHRHQPRCRRHRHPHLDGVQGRLLRCQS